MPKYKINVNAYGHSAGSVLDGQPDQKLIDARIFTLVEEEEVDDGSNSSDESGSTGSGADGGDGDGAHESSDNSAERGTPSLPS